MESKDTTRWTKTSNMFLTPPETRSQRSMSICQYTLESQPLARLAVTPDSSPRSYFSLNSVMPGESPACSEELILVRIRSLEAELRLCKEAVALKRGLQGKAAESEGTTPIGGTSSKAKNKRDLPYIKSLRFPHEIDGLDQLTSLTEENTRLKSELQAAKAFEREAKRTEELESALRTTSEELEAACNSVKAHITTIDSMIVRENQLLEKIKVLESEVYHEKEHSAETQKVLAENVKQLLAAKTACEADLAAMQEKHLRCLTNSAKVEENLRNQLELLNEECKALKEKPKIAPESQSVTQQLAQRTEENAVLQSKLAALEEKLLTVSQQWTQDRAHHFESQNILTLDIETLRTENERLRAAANAEVRDFENLRRRLEESQSQLQGESALVQRVEELISALKEKEGQLLKKQVKIEEMKIEERELERRLAAEEAHCRVKFEAERTNDAELIAQLTLEKTEAERAVFAEIERRALAENQLFSLEQIIKKMETDRNSLRDQVRMLERDMTKSFAKVDTPHRRGGILRQASAFLGKDRWHQKVETQPAEVREVEAEDQAPDPPEVKPQRSQKESLTDSRCDCTLL